MTDVSLSPEAQTILEQSSAFVRSQEFLQSMAKRNTQRDTWYRTFEDYYTSENQRVRLTDRVRRFLNVSGFMWCENFCEVVVDTLCERMLLQQMSCTLEDESPRETVQDWLDQAWKRTRMDELQSVVHTNTAMKGDGYVIVDLDNATGLSRIHWNRPEIIKPIYDSEDPENMLFAAKVWKSQLETPTNPNAQPVRRMNLYFPGTVEKWFSEAVSGSGMWAKHLDPGDTVWPIPWEDSEGEPLGVPVFHFRNKSKGRTWGISEIRGTIPQQDALNKAILDLIMIVDQNGAPQRYGTGIKQEQKGPTSGNPGSMWTTTNPDAKFGQFDPADPRGALDAIEAQLQRLAGRSRTPLFLLVLAGDAPSGESLKTAESGLVAKVKDRRTSVGNRWEDVHIMMAKIEQTTSNFPIDVDITSDLFDCVWSDPESRNVLEQATALGTYVSQLGLSKHTALEELGYDPDEESELKDEEQQEAMKNFSAGLPTVPVMDNSQNGDQSGAPPTS